MRQRARSGLWGAGLGNDPVYPAPTIRHPLARVSIFHLPKVLAAAYHSICPRELDYMRQFRVVLVNITKPIFSIRIVALRYLSNSPGYYQPWSAANRESRPCPLRLCTLPSSRCTSPDRPSIQLIGIYSRHSFLALVTSSVVCPTPVSNASISPQLSLRPKMQ